MAKSWGDHLTVVDVSHKPWGGKSPVVTGGTSFWTPHGKPSVLSIKNQKMQKVSRNHQDPSGPMARWILYNVQSNSLKSVNALKQTDDSKRLN